MRDRRNMRPLLASVAIAAGAAGLSLVLARKAAVDDEQITYPPLDVPKPVGPDIWIVDSGPISALGMKLPLRMTVVRLSNGDVLLHSPTRYTADLSEAIRAIGTIRYLVAPTIAHSTYLAEWQRACPDAETWAVAGMRDRAQVRAAGVRIDTDIPPTAPAAWADDLELGLVAGGGFREARFFHKHSRTLVLADLIENLEPRKLPPVTAMLMGALHATRATSGIHVRAALTLNRREARTAARAMIACKPERVIFAHGRCFTERGSEQLQRALAWLV